jgi:hypothetical protein
MTEGTKIRPLVRLLDASQAIVWATDVSGKLIYISGGASQWLGANGPDLVGRICVAGVALSDDPLDAIVACLSPPPDLATRGTAKLRIKPPGKRDSLDVRFSTIGDVGTIAIGGDFNDRADDPGLADAVRMRAILDDHRRFSARRSSTITAGHSLAAELTRRRIEVVVGSQTDCLLVGITGCGSHWIASDLATKHVGTSVIDHSQITIDGSILDAELLDATLMPVIGWLERSEGSCAAVIIRNLDEMPADAQARLSMHHQRFASRLRMIGLCRPQGPVQSDSTNDLILSGLFPEPAALVENLSLVDTGHRTGPSDSNRETTSDSYQNPSYQTHSYQNPSQQIQSAASLGLANRHISLAMLKTLGTFVITLVPISQRREDIPILATAMLDSRSAARAAEKPAALREAWTLTRECLDALVTYPWPGDIEELDAAIRQATSIATSARIGVEHLPLAIRSYRPGKIATELPLPKLDESVRRHEASLIERALKQLEGNRTEAAKHLDISRGRLLRKIEELQAEGLLGDV